MWIVGPRICDPLGLSPFCSGLGGVRGIGSGGLGGFVSGTIGSSFPGPAGAAGGGVTAVAVGAGAVGINLAARNDLHVAITRAAFFAVIFGFIMALIFFTIQNITNRMLHKKGIKSDGVLCVKEIYLNLPFDKSYEFSLQALTTIKKARILKQDKEHGEIEAKKGTNWKTWGDVISCKVCSIDKDKTRVEITSKPYLPSTLMDYGSNARNVEIIYDFLKQKVGFGSQNTNK